MKVQINLSEDLVAKIDKFAKAMGVSRSALCGVWIGQTVMGMESTIETGQKVIADLLKDFDSKSDDTEDDSKK